MKALIPLFATLLSTHAMGANVCSQSWDKIEEQGYKADFPKIQFDTTWMSVDGVCVSVDTLYTTIPVEVCEEWASGETSTCLKPVSKVLSTPRAYTRYLPVRETEFETMDQIHPLTYEIPVGPYSEPGVREICKKTFEIPYCAR